MPQRINRRIVKISKFLKFAKFLGDRGFIRVLAKVPLGDGINSIAPTR
jgi:hypothetical protein